MAEIDKSKSEIDKSKFRLIKRMSSDCTIYVAEDNNGNHVVVKDNEFQGTFKYQADAYRLFGALTYKK